MKYHPSMSQEKGHIFDMALMHSSSFRVTPQGVPRGGDSSPTGSQCLHFKNIL